MFSTSPFLDWLADHLSGDDFVVDPHFQQAERHVIGYAQGYSVDQIRTFVTSLRAHFDGAVTLVVDKEAEEVRAFLGEHDVLCVTDSSGGGWEPHVVVGRLAGFERLLRQARPDAVVLLTDVRDVVFQGDPLWPRPRRIEAFDEQDGQTLATHALNQKYVRAVAGDRIAEMLGDKPALCIGTVAGPAADLVRLCRIILMLCARPRSEMGGAFGADQAAFNLAIHLNLVDVEVRPNFTRVATVGVPEAERLAVRADMIVNPDGSVSPVVHQYDRHPHLVAAVTRRWGVAENLRPRRHGRGISGVMRKHMESVRKRIPELR